MTHIDPSLAVNSLVSTISLIIGSKSVVISESDKDET
jgi:hypothetical protein